MTTAVQRAAIANGTHGLRTEKMWVTPQMAVAWLEKNIDNRKVIPGHLKALEEAFRRGEIVLNGQTIKFSETGRLLDGQHRLMACASTGVGFWTLVVYGLPNEAFDTIDLMARHRTCADVLGVRGEANARALAPAINALHRFITERRFSDGGRHQVLSVAVANVVLSRHPGLRDSVSRADSSSNRLWRSAACSAVHYLFSTVSPSVADTFLSVLFDGDADTARPFTRFRESLIRSSGKRGRRSNAVVCAQAIKAFNLEMTGTRRQVLVWKGHEEFPRIVGLDYEALANSIA